MILLQETVIGLTFGQIIAVLGLFGGIIGVWIQMNVRMKAVEVKVKQLEELRKEDQAHMERIRCENREDHMAIMQKLDSLMSQRQKRAAQ